MKVSVIIPHFNDLERLQRCLERLDRQTFPRGDYEVVVADNNSRCGLEAVAAVAGDRARVIAAPEQGAGPARNTGVAASTGEILAFIDSDCMPAEDWVERGVAAVGTADFVGGRVDVLPATPGRLSPVEAFEAVFSFDFEAYVTKKGFTGSGNMFVHRRVFAAVGDFGKGLSEDVDWSHRAVAAGYRLAYAPDVVVGHPARQSWSELIAKWRRITREMYLLARTKPYGRVAWLVRSFGVLGSPLVHVVKVARTPRLARLRDRVGATAVLFAIRGYRFVEMWRLGTSSSALHHHR